MTVVGSLVVVTVYSHKPFGIVVSYGWTSGCFIVYIASSTRTRADLVEVHTDWLKEIE